VQPAEQDDLAKVVTVVPGDRHVRIVNGVMGQRRKFDRTKLSHQQSKDSMDGFLRDLSHSLRAFAKSPAFTLAAIAALTVGIAATTAIFSVVNAVMLRPISFPDPDRVVAFMNVSPQGSGPGGSPARFMHWRAQNAVVQDVAAFNTGLVNYTGGTVPEQLRAGRVSADFFTLAGARFSLGRGFAVEEDLPAGPRAVVLSEAMWATRFNRDPNVLGQSISLSGEPYTVVGVLGPFDFEEFGPTPQVWLPFQFDPNTTDQGFYFQVAGRLKPGVSLEQAQAQLAVSAEEFRAKFRDALGPQQTFSVQPIHDVLIRNARTSLLVLLGAVAFVMLIACANVANLLMVRATGRKREIAVRAALGGSRGRIIRQLLTESLVLSLVGGFLGLIVGFTGIRTLLAINTAGLPRLGVDGAAVGIDWRVLAFTLGVALVTGVLFGLFPAFQSARTDLTSTLKESSGRSGTGLRQNKARSILVVAEVALALILLIGAALLIRTAVALGSVDPGFDAGNVLTMRTAMTGPRFETAEGVNQTIQRSVDRLRGVPGVIAASATCCVPLQGGYGLPFVIVGRPLPDQNPFHGGGQWLNVAPGYFDVFRIPIRRGRDFDERDTAAAPNVVIINEAFARQYFAEADPLGQQLIIGRGVMREFATEGERQIVGVVGDTRDTGLNSNPQPAMYVPQAQVPDAANALNTRLSPMGWVVRTQGNPSLLGNQIQEALRQATGLPVTDVRTMTDVVSRSTSRQRFNMWLMTVFGVCALLLAAIGIYGLMAYSVEQRTQEIGIRLALGATVSSVKQMIVRQGMILAVTGIVIGLAAAFGLARLMQSLLFGVTTRDPVVFVGVPMVLMAVAFVAVWLPGQRASRIDPISALRYE
jgi:putative ABC transport system permease protein